MLVVGLTGNYGMGKSAVLAMFRELGAVTLDADMIVEVLLEEKGVLDEVMALFGSEVFDGAGRLDKRKVADIIFKEPTLRIALENILHPLVFERIRAFINGMNNSDKIVIIEAPVIFERGYQNRFDRIITVYASLETAIMRLKEHGVSEEKAMQRISSQFPIDKKIAGSDFIIDNNGSMEDTRIQVERIYRKLSEEAGDGDYSRA